MNIREFFGLDEKHWKGLIQYTGLFLLFMIIYACLFPLIRTLEPNPYPKLGNAVFYSLTKTMDTIYFFASFALFLGLSYVLYKKKIISFPDKKEGKPKNTRTHTLLLLSLFILPPAFLLLQYAHEHAQPYSYTPDYFHQGEVIIHQDKSFSTLYTTYNPFKNVFFHKIFTLLGMDDNIKNYFPLEIIITLTSIVYYFLFLFIYRLIRGSYSLVPAIIFFILKETDFLLMLNDRLLFFLTFLALLVVYLIYKKKWLFFLSALALSAQGLVSVEYLIYGGVGLACFILISSKRLKDFFMHAGIAIIAFLPLAILLLANHQGAAYAQFISYQSETHYANGRHLFPGLPYFDQAGSFENHGLTPATLLSAYQLIRFIVVWAAILFAAGLLLYDLANRKRRDPTYLWLYTILIVTIIVFKSGLGHESHLKIPAQFAIIAAFSILASGRITLGIPQFYKKWPIPTLIILGLILFGPFMARYANGSASSEILLEQHNLKTPMAYEESLQAYIPSKDHEQITHLRELLKYPDPSIFFFSDEPYYNHILGQEYPLRNPVLYDINNEEMLIQETERLSAWNPDLIVWKTDSLSNSWTGIRNPVRYYTMSAWILEHYTPYISLDSMIILKRDGLDIPTDVPNGEQITWDNLTETYALYDFPYNVGRTETRGVNFTTITLDLPQRASCTYTMGDDVAFTFTGHSGKHNYAFYPQASPIYNQTPHKVTCT